MKIFTNKNLIQKIIIVFVCVFLLNFCMAPSVQATFGGSLFTPMKEFITAIADIFITLVQWGITGDWISAVDSAANVVNLSNNEVWDNGLVKQFEYPIIQISPELIFANRIRLLDIDFIGDTSDDIEDSDNKIVIGDGEVISTLRTIIASWYVTLRTIAIIGLLSVLIYIGIRIIISSTSADKAKYKQNLMDWIIAFCILLFMHYIMSGTINIVNKIDDLLAEAGNVGEGIGLDTANFGTVQYNGSIKDSSYDQSDQKIQIVKDYLKEQGFELAENTPTAGSQNGDYGSFGGVNSTWTFKDVNNDTIAELTWDVSLGTYSLTNTVFDKLDGNQTAELNEKLATKNEITSVDTEEGSLGKTITANDKPIYVSTDSSKILYYINYARLYVNLDDPGTSFGFIILYVILIVFTTMFAVRYMKRVIYVAFLTLIAPLVALTYPIDKLRDGQAQAFNMWFREYVFNVMIQPFHLLIYTVLVGSAMALASEHMIYAIVAIGFLIPAEKLLRKFFGFDKAGTLSAAGSFAGGAIFSSVLNKINKPKPGGKGGSGSNGESSRGIRKPSAPNDFNSQNIVTGMMAGGALQNKDNKDDNKNDNKDNQNTAKLREPQNSEDELNDNAEKSSDTYEKNSADEKEIESQKMKDLTKKVFDDKSKWAIARDHFGERIRNGAYMGGYRLKRQIADKAKTLPKSAGRLIRRGAIGGFVGGSLGTIGLAVGAASGDPSKAFSLAAAGGAAGYYGANYYGDKLAKGVGKDFQSSKVAFWGKNIKQIEQAKFDKEFLANADNREKLLRALGSPEAVEEAINDGSVQAFLNTGYTDAAKIGKSLKLLKENKVHSLEEAVAIVNWEKNIGPAIFDPTSEHRRSYVDRTVKELKRQSSDSSKFDESSARASVENLLNTIDERIRN